MKPVAKHLGIILGVALLTLFLNLGAARLWDRDEPRNAGCAAEMLARGDWVVPWFNDELRAHKPVLLYWFMMLSYSVLGISEFSARLPSALLALGTTLMTYGMGRRLFNERVALWGAIALCSSLMFDVAGRAATPDAILIFFVTGALATFVGFVEWGKERFQVPDFGSQAADVTSTSCIHFPGTWWQGALIYAWLGGAVLAKGPVGVLLPVAVIGLFLLVSQRAFSISGFLRTAWSMRPLTLIGVVLAIALPWYVMVGVRTNGEFLEEFFLQHNLSRATQSLEGHRGGPWYYPVALLVGFFPWSVFMGPMLIDTWRQLCRKSGEGEKSNRAGYLFATCWAILWIIAFSLARTKLPSYITPCYPAVALLTGCFIDRWLTGTMEIPIRAARWSLGCFGLVGIGLLVGLPFATAKYLPNEKWLAVIGVIPLLGAVLSLIWNERGRRAASGVAFASAAIAFSACLMSVVVPRVSRHQQNQRLLTAMRELSDDPQLAAFQCLEPSWVFYGGRPIREVLLSSQPQPTPSQSLHPPPVPLTKFFTGPDRFVITTRRRLPELQAELPPDAAVVAEVPLFLKNEQLVIVGRGERVATRIREQR